MIWYVADEHYFHTNCLKYDNSPFSSIEEKDEYQIQEHNKLVKPNDIVIHAGDFTLIRDSKIVYKKYVNRLKGNHIFLKGSHDRWLPDNAPYIWEKKVDGNYIVVCHYALRVWPRSHYNSWHCFGHSHGRLDPIGKQQDIGIMNNDFKPFSNDNIIEIMKNRPDNPNIILDKYKERNEV